MSSVLAAELSQYQAAATAEPADTALTSRLSNWLPRNEPIIMATAALTAIRGALISAPPSHPVISIRFVAKATADHRFTYSSALYKSRPVFLTKLKGC